MQGLLKSLNWIRQVLIADIFTPQLGFILCVTFYYFTKSSLFQCVCFGIYSPQAAVPPPAKDWSKESDDVVFLTSANFDDFAKEKSDMLVMFYAPCKFFEFF